MEKRLSHIHFWCTIAGILLFIPNAPAARLCFTVGANSLYVALCYGGFETFVPLVKLCAFWFVAFPVVYITLYMLAVKKKQYIPFGVLISLDAAFCCISAIVELGRENTYGFVFLLPDIIISSIFCLLYFFADCFHKKRNRQIMDTNEENAS